ncbi:MAG: YybH family protein [bacterium]
MSTTGPDDRETIRVLLRKINDAWVKGDPDDLSQYFHEDIVIVAPRFQGIERGREACVRSYKEFTSQARTHEYVESDAAIEQWDDTAVATYRYDITYEMDGTVYRESGWDVFVFRRDNERWRAVWRTLIPSA